MNQRQYPAAVIRGGRTFEHGALEGSAKVLRQTYMLLSMTLLFSAVTAGASMALGVGYGTSLICSLVSLGLLWFVVPRTANSEAGIWVVFAVTGLLGFGLGPILNRYLGTANGAQTVMTALGLTGGAAAGVRETLEALEVNAERMRANLERTRGLVYSQRVLLALTSAGLSREEAYALVQRHAMEAWKEPPDLLERLLADPAAVRTLGREGLSRCFDPAHFLRHVSQIFDRVLGASVAAAR